jgi:hypothetical protein
MDVARAQSFQLESPPRTAVEEEEPLSWIRITLSTTSRSVTVVLHKSTLTYPIVSCHELKISVSRRISTLLSGFVKKVKTRRVGALSVPVTANGFS